MDENLTAYLEHDVSDATTFNIRRGTLVLYPSTLVFYYNAKDKTHHNREEDLMHLHDIVRVTVKDVNWLVKKFIWSDRKIVVVETHEGEKKYYMKHPIKLVSALTRLNPKIEYDD